MPLTRRETIIGAGAVCASTALPARAQITRKIAFKSGARLPVIGMGTWLTFDIDPNGLGMRQRAKVLKEFFAHGGGMIDSSPMYGHAETVIGKLMQSADMPRETYFTASKIWIALANGGPAQLANTHARMDETVLDLMYVHNLLSWEAHLKTLRAAKEAGSVRYIGLTTSHGRRHGEMERLIKREPIDAVQFTYNIQNRAAENRLLPAAQDQGLAVIINRPFRGGALFDQVRGKPLPPWALDIGVNNWAQFFLKFAVSHPAVTCAIPATSNPDHMRENMGAGRGPMPDAAMRRKMAAYFDKIL